MPPGELLPPVCNFWTGSLTLTTHTGLILGCAICCNDVGLIDSFYRIPSTKLKDILAFLLNAASIYNMWKNALNELHYSNATTLLHAVVVEQVLSNTLPQTKHQISEAKRYDVIIFNSTMQSQWLTSPCIWICLLSQKADHFYFK